VILSLAAKLSLSCKDIKSLQVIESLTSLGLTLEKRERKLKFNLGDDLSEEMVERDSILYGLLNGDICFVLKHNSGKQIVVCACATRRQDTTRESVQTF
jgi:hypothetical protein